MHSMKLWQRSCYHCTPLLKVDKELVEEKAESVRHLKVCFTYCGFSATIMDEWNSAITNSIIHILLGLL